MERPRPQWQDLFQEADYGETEDSWNPPDELMAVAWGFLAVEGAARDDDSAVSA